MRVVSRRSVGLLVSCVLVFLSVFFGETRDAQAVPSFARKYQTSCQTCHTIYPVLNPFGEAFRRNGYRFPSQDGSVDSDAVKTTMIPLGQEEYTKTFPQSVWPDKIADAVPLSVMLNGTVAFNFPNSDANDGAGNTFTWGNLVGEVHLFGAGALNDSLTYFTQLTIPSDGPVDIETGYLLWNDIIGPRHLFNLWVGRLFSPQITSFGLHSSYLNDTFTPAISIVGLYNPTGSAILGQGHADGVEANGIVNHRVGWSLGWIASSAAGGLKPPNAEDVYAHIGVKSGGVALDGEGKYGPNAPNPMKPWAETSITFDLFAYHGLNLLDNGTGVAATATTPAVPVGQRDTFEAIGGSIQGMLESLVITTGFRLERHQKPYQGTPASTAPDGTITPAAANFADATGWVNYNEIDYVVFPWLVPGVRTEFTHMNIDQSNPASLLRVIPGVAMLIRPDLKLVLTGDFERGYGVPVAGSWAAAGGNVVTPGPGRSSEIEAEQINLTAALAF